MKMKFFKPEQERSSVPEENRVCVVRDWVNYEDTPTPTFVELLVGADMFIGMRKRTPEETSEALRRFKGGLVNRFRRHVPGNTDATS